MAATLRRLKIGIPTETPAADKWVNLTEQLNKQFGHIEDFLRSMPIAAVPATPAVVTPITVPPFPTTSPTGGGGSGGAAPVDASYVTVSNESGLNFERVLTGGTNITLTDGGANGNLTIDAAAPPSLPLFTPQTSAATPVTIGAGNVAFFGSAAVGADQVANLPAATGSGFIKIVKKMDANLHYIVVTAAGGDLIDGAATFKVGNTVDGGINDALAIIDQAAAVWKVLWSYVP